MRNDSLLTILLPVAVAASAVAICVNSLLMCPEPLFCSLLTRTITKRAVAWVGSLQPECTVPMSTWNFRNFKPEYFVEWKASVVYNNLIMCLSSITINHWSGLVPVPLLPRPSRSVYFGDVSKTLGPRDPKPIGRAIAENLKEKSLLTYKVSNTFMRVPNRVLQSRNLEPNFAQSRIPAFFQSRISPSFCFKIPNPELQIREIPHPGKLFLIPFGIILLFTF